MNFGRTSSFGPCVPCSLCGQPATGKYGLRVGEHRYVVCSDRACLDLPGAEARKRLAERAAAGSAAGQPMKRGKGATWANKGAWRQGGARCSSTCKLRAGHRGKCYQEEK